MLALDDAEAARLEHIRGEMEEAGANVTPVDAMRALALVPVANPATLAALWMPDEGIVNPMRLTVAYASLAVTNGVTLRLGERVSRVEREDAGKMTVFTPKGRYRGRFIVNAAGVWAGDVSRLVGGEDFQSRPRKGQYVILDRIFGSQLPAIVFCTHMPTGKGTNVVPTTHGSALLGPTSQDLEDPFDKSTSASSDHELLDAAARLVPAVRDAYVIKRFAANRPDGDEQHRLRIDARVPSLLHVTDRSSGVSTSPAAGEHALQLLRAAGLDCADRPDAVKALPNVESLRTASDLPSLVAKSPLHGQVVCACEHVSAAEIDAALSGPVPASSIDGVRKRTGAGYGRCQGSLCLAGVAFMTALGTGTGPANVRQTVSGTVGA